MTNTPLSKYEAFFGRPADFILEAQPDATSAIFIGTVSGGIRGRLFTPVHDRFVYVTYGMSTGPMLVPPDQAQIYPLDRR